MRLSIGAMVVVGLSAVGLSAVAARAEEPRGIPLGSKDRVSFDLFPSGDRDDFVMKLSAGSLLSASVKSGSRVGPLMEAELFRPDGTSFPIGPHVKGAGSARLSLKKVPIDTTGTWVLRITALSRLESTSSIVAKVKPPKKSKIKGTVFPAGSTTNIPFGGDDLTSVTFKVKVKSGPGFDDVSLVDPAGDDTGATIGTKGSSFQGKNIILQDGFGEYALRLAASGDGGDSESAEDTVADVLVKAKAAKVAKRTLSLEAEPTLAAVSPTLAVEDWEVQITGSEFRDGVRVWFGDSEATDVVVVSGEELTCTVPGPVDTGEDLLASLHVQNSDGQAADAPLEFTYAALPSVTVAIPAEGPASGGIGMEVFGAHFRGTPTVLYGGQEALDVAVVNEGYLTCTTPAHAAGQIQTALVDEFGRETNAVGNHTVVAPPVLTAVGPLLSPLGGDVTVLVEGLGFRDEMTVELIDGKVLEAEVQSETRLTFSAPAHGAGRVPVRLLDEWGQTSEYEFGLTYVAAPEASSVTPSVSPLAGGVEVTIEGRGFRDGASVTVGGTSATEVTVMDETTITCMTPAHAAGAAEIRVSDEFGQMSAALDGHAFVGAPTASSALPDALPLAGDVSVTITGSDFREGLSLFVDGEEMGDVTVESSTEATFTAPSAEEGEVDVELVDEFDQSATAVGLLQYVGAPEATGIDPEMIPKDGGAAMTLYGSDFRSGMSVFVDGTDVGTVTVKSTSEAAFTAPSGTLGLADVKVQDAYGQFSIAEELVEYASVGIWSVTPPEGDGEKDIRVLIRGFGFEDRPTVKFDAGDGYPKIAYAINRIDENTILCRVPEPSALHAFDAIVTDVSVINPSGSSTKLDDAFSYRRAGDPMYIVDSFPPANSTNVSRTLERVVIIMSRRLYAGIVQPLWYDFYRAASSGYNDIPSPRVSNISRGIDTRMLVFTRGGDSYLSTNSDYVVLVSVNVKDSSQHFMDPRPYAGVWGGIDFSTKTSALISTPALRSLSPTFDATDVPVDSTMVMEFSYQVDPAEIDDYIHLTDEDGNEVEGVYSISNDLKWVTYTPRWVLKADSEYSLLVEKGFSNLYGVAATSSNQADFTTAAKDGEDPEVFLTVSGLPSTMNGSGTYAAGSSDGKQAGTGSGNATNFDVQIPQSGFTIDLELNDPGGSGVDLSTLVVTCDKKMGTTAANTNLASQFTATLTGATWLVPSSHKLGVQNDVTFTVDIDDAEGNSAAQQSLTVDVEDIAGTPTGKSGDRDPFSTRSTWLLRFDQDIYTLTASAGTSTHGSHSNPIKVASAASSNGVSDFEEDLTLLGLNGSESASGASTVTNGNETGANAIVQRMVMERVRAYLRVRFAIEEDGSRTDDSPNIEFILAGEKGSLSAEPNPSQWTSSSGYSMLTMTGDVQPTSSGVSSGTLGRATLDHRNTGDESDVNTGSASTALGVFGTNLARSNVNEHEKSPFARVFDKLIKTNSRGGKPVGEHSLDATVLDEDWVYASANGSQRARWREIDRAIDRWALILSLVTCHEIGHSVGLVAEGAPPTGLFGNAHPNSPFVVSGNLTDSSHLDTVGVNPMQASISDWDVFATESFFSGFSPMNLAYLQRRLLYDR